MLFRNGRAGGGYGQAFGVWGERAEQDTFTCSHCQRVVVIKAQRDLPKTMGRVPTAHQDVDGFCRLCDRRICGPCLNSKEGCIPFEKKLEKMEAKSDFFRHLEECLNA